MHICIRVGIMTDSVEPAESGASDKLELDELPLLELKLELELDDAERKPATPTEAASAIVASCSGSMSTSISCQHHSIDTRERADAPQVRDHASAASSPLEVTQRQSF